MITLIIKGTNGCNLRCKYCSIGEKNEKYQLIDTETLKLAGNFIVRQAEEHGDNNINVIFHGGEPTLINPKIYHEFIDYLLKTYSGISFKFSMQTNGFHFTDEYISFIKEYGISIGISIDGDEKTHDSLRVDCNGNCTFSKIKENILKLKSEGIMVSVLVVVTKTLLNVGLSYLDFFNIYNIDVKINPLLNYGEASDKNSLWLRDGDYSDYIIKVYEYILNHEIKINIAPISSYFNAIVNKIAMSECSYKNECGKQFFCVDYKGDIYPCGRYCDQRGSCLGSVYNNTFTEFMQPELSKECFDCKFYKWCYGGCSAYRKIMCNNKSPLCYDIKKLFEYFSNEGIDEYINYLKKRKSVLMQRISEVEDMQHYRLRKNN